MGNTFIIAEAGVNHNGSLKMAKRLIDAAVEAGADAVKFQMFKAENLVSPQAPKADYQKRLTDQQESQLEMLQKLELDLEAHKQLIAYCCGKGIEFLSTPFDQESLNLLVQTCELSKIKIGSAEITNAPLLLQLARYGKEVILSTGMATLGEIEFALAVLAYGYTHATDIPSSTKDFYRSYASAEGQKALQEKVTLLHCTTEYPAPFSEVNLRVMDTLKQAFGLPTGLSDHTSGITIPIAAVARGAVIIEKHLTLDRTLPGPDHQASLEPHDFKCMVESIRQVEQALGHTVKYPTPSELKNRPIARKSLVAKREIRKGEIFTEDNITVKRPGTGISPTHYWEYLGKQANQNYQKDELIR